MAICVEPAVEDALLVLPLCRVMAEVPAESVTSALPAVAESLYSILSCKAGYTRFALQTFSSLVTQLLQTLASAVLEQSSPPKPAKIEGLVVVVVDSTYAEAPVTDDIVTAAVADEEIKKSPTARFLKQSFVRMFVVLFTF